MADDLIQLQQDLHDYFTPHPEMGKDEDDRGCVPCWLIATHLYAKGWTLDDAIRGL